MSTGPLNVEPVFAFTPSRRYNGSSESYVDFSHRKALAVSDGTLSLGFRLDRKQGDMALISKDLSGTNEGDFTVWVQEGRLAISMEGPNGTEYLRVPDLILDAHTTYHLAVSFGKDGLMLSLNGQLVAAEPDFTYGLDTNDNSLVIGGTRAWRGSNDESPHSLLQGKVQDVMLYDSQLSESQMMALASDVDPTLGAMARAASQMDDLMPAHLELHHGTETFQDFMATYGFGYGSDGQGMGGMGAMGSTGDHAMAVPDLKMMIRGNGNQMLNGSNGADGLSAGAGNDELRGNGGADVLQGGYGNDRLFGGAGNDVLDGGHGEDILVGAAGNDLLISRSDAREPYIAYDPDRDEGDPDNELTNGKLYPNQPIPADDKLTGGTGADIFYFQTLINAKERFIRKHTRDDGTIKWHDVAGENDDLHDHWVDGIGNDYVMDFNRGEGDRIVIEGHTTEIQDIVYGDFNKDGVLDHSVISIYSDQGGGGGAHNQDELGTITVYGDLVRLSDIEQTAAPTYGIVATIDDLDEALKPTQISKDTGRIVPNQKDLPTAGDMALQNGVKPVFAIDGSYDFERSDKAAIATMEGSDLNLRNGTISFSFTADSIGDQMMLFTKDASGYGDGGHMSIYVTELGGLKVRIQSDTDSHYMEVDFAIDVGTEYDVALNFGHRGAELYLNGARVAYDTDFTMNWIHNDEGIVIGASGQTNTPGTLDDIGKYFDGTISDVRIFDRAMTGEQIFGRGPRDDTVRFSGKVQDYAFARADDGSVLVTKGGTTTKVGHDIDFMAFSNVSVRPMEVQFGSTGIDTQYGRDGADILQAQGGNDRLYGKRNDDLLRGGGGDDELYGGEGDDILFGQTGTDRVYGGDGVDILYGGEDADYLYGEDGSDRFYGGFGDDWIYGHTWKASGDARNDRAFYDGNRSDYSFATETYWDNNRGETVNRLVITDSANGGRDGNYEGADRLIDIDLVVFADQSVAFNDLI